MNEAMKTNLVLHSILIGCGLLFMGACDSSINLEEGSTYLPAGRFPLEFSRFGDALPRDSAASRITEDRNNVSCYWSEGDRIGIRVKGGGNDGQGTCTLSADGGIENTGLFWHTSLPASVSAWYPADGKEISLVNQRRRLSYVLLAGPVQSDYKGGPIRLVFHHQLAKVRILLTGNMGWLLKAQLSILGYTSCSFQGEEFVPGKEKGYISMRTLRGRKRYYEANVFPMTIQKGEDILLISILFSKKRFTLEEEVTLEAGKMYTFELDANWFH